MDRKERIESELAEHNRKFTCNHDKVELRKRILSNGSIQYAHQCLTCGKSDGKAVSKIEVGKLFNGNEPQLFDATLLPKWKQEMEEDYKKIVGDDKTRAEAKIIAFWEDYNEYMESEEWRIRREKVIKRANHICEGCGDKTATQAHHLSYKHVKKEFLFELVAVCEDCHIRLHDEDVNRGYQTFLREVRQ